MEKDVLSLWRIGEILIQKGWINWEQLENALAVQQESGRRMGEILVENGAVSTKRLFKALAIQSGMAFVDLEAVTAQPEAIRSVPKRLVFEYRLIPLVNKDQTLLIAISDPHNIWPEEELRGLTEIRDIRTVLSCPDDIDKAILQYYGSEGLAA